MSEAIIFEGMPYNLFLKQRMEFVVICGDHLAANVMRVIESEMIKLKEQWQARVEKALEEKKSPPKEPKAYWVRLSLSQMIARLYMYDSGKLKKPENEDLNSPEWVEYRFKKALSISKGTLRKAIDLLKSLGFLLERSKPGDEFGAPIWTLHKENVQAALKTLPTNPFAIFHAPGGGSKFECGGEVQNLNVPPTKFECGDTQNLNVPGSENESGEVQNLNVDIDNGIDTLLENEIDNGIEGTYSAQNHEAGTCSSLDSPTHASSSLSQDNATESTQQAASSQIHIAGSMPETPQQAHQTSEPAPAGQRRRDKTPPPPSSQDGAAPGAGYVKSQGKGGKRASEKPAEPTFTSEGQKVYDAWASLFKSPPPVGEQTIKCANDLYARLMPWCKDLRISCKDLLKEIKGFLFATSTNGFYKRGVTLCDIHRDFEKWQSAKTETLEAEARQSHGKSQPKSIDEQIAAADRATKEFEARERAAKERRAREAQAQQAGRIVA